MSTATVRLNKLEGDMGLLAANMAQLVAMLQGNATPPPHGNPAASPAVPHTIAGQQPLPPAAPTAKRDEKQAAKALRGVEHDQRRKAWAVLDDHVASVPTAQLDRSNKPLMIAVKQADGTEVFQPAERGQTLRLTPVSRSRVEPLLEAIKIHALLLTAAEVATLPDILKRRAVAGTVHSTKGSGNLSVAFTDGLQINVNDGKTSASLESQAVYVQAKLATFTIDDEDEHARYVEQVRRMEAHAPAKRRGADSLVAKVFGTTANP
jgi:hypothetical protein